MEHELRVRAHVMVEGRVHQVGFRAFAQSQAGRRGLSGWVKNLPDGRVETEVEGAPALVEEFLSAIAQGPPLAHVRDTRVEWLTPNVRESTFEIIE